MTTVEVQAPVITLEDFMTWYNNPLSKVKDLTDNVILPDGTNLTKKGVEALCVQATSALGQEISLELKPKNVKKVYVPVFAVETAELTNTESLVVEENQFA